LITARKSSPTVYDDAIKAEAKALLGSDTKNMLPLHVAILSYCSSELVRKYKLSQLFFI